MSHVLNTNPTPNNPNQTPAAPVENTPLHQETSTEPKEKSAGVTIRTIKKALKKAGWPLVVNDEWDRPSQNALREFQKNNGLTPDLKVGPKTAEKLGL